MLSSKEDPKEDDLKTESVAMGSQEEASGELLSRSLRRSMRGQTFKDVPYRIKTLFHNVDGKPHLNSKKMELIHENPNIYFVRDFLTEGEIKHMDRVCTNQLKMKKFQNSFVEDDYNNEVICEDRTSTYIHLSKAQDGPTRSIESRACSLAGLASECCEPLQIVSYTQGQKFETHHDAGTLLEDGSVFLVPPRRLVTLFVYLNTIPEGHGHTEFPELGLSVKPERGCGVLFCNMLPNGDVDKRTCHRAAPLNADLRKFGINVWISDNSMQELALNSKKVAVGEPLTDTSKSAFSLADEKTRIYEEALSKKREERFVSDKKLCPHETIGTVVSCPYFVDDNDSKKKKKVFFRGTVVAYACETKEGSGDQLYKVRFENGTVDLLVENQFHEAKEEFSKESSVKKAKTNDDRVESAAIVSPSE
jgi:prolyl 4-hydroxylase